MDRSTALFGWLILFLTFLAGLSVWAAYRRSRGGPGVTPRMRARMGMRLLRSQLLLGAVIVFTHDARIWNGAQVGVTGTPWWLALLAGAAIYPPFVILVNVLARALGVHDRMVVAAFNGLRQVYPRSSLQKGAFTVAVVLLNPITEEWLYRGVAVVWLANQTHPLPAVCFGLAVSLSVHAYQGLFLAPFQFAFHAIACALVFSPLGLLGAMGFHFLGDAYPMYRLRKQMPFWIAERRKQISTARNAKFAMESSHHDR